MNPKHLPVYHTIQALINHAELAGDNNTAIVLTALSGAKMSKTDGILAKRMELNRQTVAELLPLLQKFVETGDLF